MTSYDVNLVFENLELTDDVLARLYDALPDMVAAGGAASVTVTSPIDAPDAEAAAVALRDRVIGLVPEARFVRVDQDLVSIPDIAQRTGRSRESVRLLVEGKRRSASRFPEPVGVVGGGTRIWPWAAVVDWFRDALDEDLGEHGVPPTAAAMVDAASAHREALRLLPTVAPIKYRARAVSR